MGTIWGHQEGKSSLKVHREQALASYWRAPWMDEKQIHGTAVSLFGQYDLSAQNIKLKGLSGSSGTCSSLVDYRTCSLSIG